MNPRSWSIAICLKFVSRSSFNLDAAWTFSLVLWGFCIACDQLSGPAMTHIALLTILARVRGVLF